ncbi:MAG: UvrD-helicase domain-containing protein [Desulfobulbus sp.]
MKYIADLHVHSLYSRATSKNSHLHGLAAWAAVKGIAVVATGDCTHPRWFAHLSESLEPAEPVFFRLQSEPGRDWGAFLPEGLRPPVAPESVRFVLSAEISSIYKRDGRVRKVHNLLYFPDFEAVRSVNATLAGLGNIASDGRPILGLDCRDLLEILLSHAPEGFFVPAHIWTPWFSLFGSKSGFDSLEDCFGPLSSHIFALETGLSSDPEMNRLVSALDRFTLISNSDCHSPAKLGREANIFTTGFDFFSLRDALRSPVDASGQQAFAATIEFYPEEGKYHCDGHRACGVCCEPAETRRHEGLCPVCGKPLTIGVLHRVMELADRSEPVFPPGSPAVHSLIPLPEIVAELLDCGPTSKKVGQAYTRLINTFGAEFSLLLDTSLDDLRTGELSLLAEALERVRTKRVIRQPGYDGAFGVIRTMSEGERAQLCGQGTLFASALQPARGRTRRTEPLAAAMPAAQAQSAPASRNLNPEQQRAVDDEAQRILVQAGPGTGKTHTLVARVLRMLSTSSLPCTVIAFTNKAADEIRERIRVRAVDAENRLTVATFHGFCLAQLRRVRPQLRVVGPEERELLLDELREDDEEQRQSLVRTITRYGLSAAVEESDALWARYCRELRQRNLVDLDCLVADVVQVLREDGAEADRIRAAVGLLFVDEFQDVNQAQYELVALLAASSPVFAIGDPDQAIYGFRGADPRWFHAFGTVFQPEIHLLTRNYRSGANILAAAGQVIARNPHADPCPTMHACSTLPGTLHRFDCASPEQEALCIADQIELQLGGTSHRGLDRFDHSERDGVSLRDIGVLYRTGRQAEVIGRVLHERGIPFQLVHLEAFYTKGPCRPLYLWLLVLAGLAGPGESVALLAGEQGVGRKSLRRLRSALVAGDGEVACLEQVRLDGAAEAGRARFLALHARLRAQVAAGPLALVDVLAGHYGLADDLPDLVRLRDLVRTFSGLAECAAHLHRFSDSVLYDHKAEAVTLSTLHAAKGLEFPVVFIAGLEDGLLPLAPRETLTPAALRAHIEEERRLLYVGMTRAVATLYLGWSRSRSLFGGPPQERRPSPLLAGLPETVFTPLPRVRRSGKKTTAHRQLSLFSKT